jgi:serine/threonine protein kinase
MPASSDIAPTTEELHAFGMGKLDSPRAAEVERYLAEHPELVTVLEATPDDAVVRPLRGARVVPQPRARSPLLDLAVEGVIPVLGGCAGALAGGVQGGFVGVVAGQAAEKAINFFGKQIVEKWMGRLRKQPPGMQAAALTQLAEILPEVARSAVSATLEKQAPHLSPADRQVALDYLSAIPRSVRRSLLTDHATGGKKLPPRMSLDDSLCMLQLLPADLPPYSAPTALPETGYRLEELIGSGGFGAVYRASGASLQHLPLAIKFCLDCSLLPALKQERTNLERLMEAGGKSWSPRIVRLYGYNLEHTTPFLVYENVPGGDLVHWLVAHSAPHGPGPTAAEVLEVIIQVAEALAFAHERGLVHRDLKPANVLTGEGTIKLADFGIGGVAARQAVEGSQIGTVAASRLSLAEQASLFRGAGTPLYMSQEQRRGEAPDPRQDVYSLGVMWYQLLVGDVSREMSHGWARELAVRFAVPREQIELIERCVGWIEERPKDAGELLPLLTPLAHFQVKAMEVSSRGPLSVPNTNALLPSATARSSDASHNAVSTQESDQFRRFRFMTAVKKLLECHEEAETKLKQMRETQREEATDSRGSVIRWIVFMLLMAMIPVGLGSIAKQVGMGKLGEENRWLTGFGAVLLLTGVIGGVTMAAWGLLRHGKRLAEHPYQILSSTIEQLLTDFPLECRTWGGAAALDDKDILKRILTELEARKE